MNKMRNYCRYKYKYKYDACEWPQTYIYIYIYIYMYTSTNIFEQRVPGHWREGAPPSPVLWSQGGPTVLRALGGTPRGLGGVPGGLGGFLFDDFLRIYWKSKKTINEFVPIQILYWVLDGTNIGPYCAPPIPSPASAKVSCQGPNKLMKTYFW